MQKRLSNLAKEAGFPTWGEQTDLTSLNEAEASFAQYLFGADKSARPKAGENILVADVGGGTADVSIFELTSSQGHDAELTLRIGFSGRYVGSTRIDEDFREQLAPALYALYEKKLSKQTEISVDATDLKELVNAALVHVEHEDEYARQKHIYGATATKGRLTKKSNFTIMFRHPIKRGKLLDLSIDKQAYFEDAFIAQIEETWDLCTQQMEALPDGVAVHHVVLAGGLGTSPYVVPKLKKRFKSHSRSNEATVASISEPQLAVSRGLVRYEQRMIQGRLGWNYSAEASYGIRMKGAKESTKWFLLKGKRLKIPQASPAKVSFDVKVDRTEPLGEFTLVRSESATPTSKGARVVEIYDISTEVKVRSLCFKDVRMRAEHQHPDRTTCRSLVI